MRILSIDVGMRNLAYCYIETKADKTFTVGKWEVVNLCLDEPHKCCGIISNKRKNKDKKKIKKKRSATRVPGIFSTMNTIVKFTQKKQSILFQQQNFILLD